ncbi:unnamed protein product [Acanthoscelides obtectus]|uniref:Uncharacterized protein n=1 Tax=Acanthoscelides obtectus TaxID=200917 RepID=A0A9P0L1C2_ACAOB|nr:unnamed protein product [Acanthoscelides obtectus]CAK1650577.1 hypothetical protein AOBTE_LOCUS16816 [Acanthoscelides obtectus]
MALKLLCQRRFWMFFTCRGKL